MNDFSTLSQRADAHEAKMARELDYVFIKSRLHLSPRARWSCRRARRR